MHNETALAQIATMLQSPLGYRYRARDVLPGRKKKDIDACLRLFEKLTKGLQFKITACKGGEVEFHAVGPALFR